MILPLLYLWPSNGGKSLLIRTWNGVTGLATAEACCCGQPTGCQLLTGNLQLTIRAPGCDIDGISLVLYDISLGLGDRWHSDQNGNATFIDLGGCLYVYFELTCSDQHFVDNPGADWCTGYRLTAHGEQSSGCKLIPASNIQGVPGSCSISPLSWEFSSELHTEVDPVCPCCPGLGFPQTVTFEISRP